MSERFDVDRMFPTILSLFSAISLSSRFTADSRLPDLFCAEKDLST